MSDCRRGYLTTDEKEFNSMSQTLLRKAQKDLLYLLEQGYPIKNASTFVGNHYLLSERQRLAVVRATTTNQIIELRQNKQIKDETICKKFVLDGLNIIITLEVALSEGTLLRCMDGTIRDLAGLRGTYRLIDKTDTAILLIGDKLKQWKCEEAIFYLDAPVSNTGRLKMRIFELLGGYPYQTKVELVNNPDAILEKMNCVITSDAIILNKCLGWLNMTEVIIKEIIPSVSYIDLSCPI